MTKPKPANKKDTLPQKPENQTSQEPLFAIQRIYLKDLSFESPNSPNIFLEEWEPNVDLDLRISTEKTLEDNHHEVLLKITLTTKIKEQFAFLAELQMAGIFLIEGFPKKEMEPMLGIVCPNILYPYAREVVSDMTVRGGFPPLYLSPINFEALFHESKQKKNNKIH